MKKRLIITLVVAISIIIAGILIYFLIFNNNNYKNSKEEDTYTYTPPLYKVCDEDSCIYVLGTMHIGDERIQKLSDKVYDAYNDSDILAVEVDTTEVTLNIFDFVAEDDIESTTTEDFRSKLIEFGEENKLFKYESLKYYKIGFIENYIVAMLYQDLGFSYEGVDSFLLRKAHEEGKDIYSIETMDEQIKFITDYSDDLYINLIEESIDNYDATKEEGKELYDAYLTGDIDKLNELIDLDINQPIDNGEYEQYIKDMYDIRNDKMVKKAKEFLNNNDKVLIVVGAAHVITDNGIIEQLKEGNYKVECIK